MTVSSTLRSGGRRCYRRGGGSPPGRRRRHVAGAVSLSLVLPVVLTVVPSSLLVLLRRPSVRASAGRPPSLPARQAGAVRIHLGLQEIQQRHGQLQIGALVAIQRVASPALIEAVHQVSHPTVVFPRQEISPA
jgi:hypothetical protein